MIEPLRCNVVRTRAAFSLAVLLTCARPAFSLNLALDVRQYAHTAWTIGDGLLNSRVSAIAQTPDGYLWLGTESGLLRFDGIRMVRWLPRADEHLPSTTIVRLLVTRDGRLWIGTLSGLASLKDSRLVTYPEFAGAVVSALAEGSDGTLWAGTISLPNGRLCAIGRAVQCTGQDGRFGNGVFSLFDDRGTLWAGTATGVWRWAPGEPDLHPAPTTANIRSLIRINDGPLLVAMAGGVRQLRGEKLDAYRIEGVDEGFDAVSLLLDRDGGFWIGTGRRGLIHVHRGRVDRYLPSDGLSGDLVGALYEDREGNIWAATNNGLDRFREFAVSTIDAKQGLPTDSAHSVLAAKDGSVWTGSSGGLTRWKDNKRTIYGTPAGLPDDHVGTLFQDSTGRILVSTLNGMAVSHGDRFVPLRSVTAHVVYAIVENRPGDFWISDVDQGLIRVVGEEAVQRIPWSALGRDDHATAVVADPLHGLWLGFYKGGVVHWSDGVIRTSYGATDGLGAGRVAQLQFDRDGALWAATAGGLSRIKDSRVTTLTTANGLPCDGVHWNIADADGSLWMLMPCGLSRIGSMDLAEWIANPGRSVRVTLLDSADGTRTESTPSGFTPSVVAFPDGRLWFAAPSGIGVVEPRRHPFDAPPPPVHIEQIVADRETYDPTIVANGTLQLPPHIRDLQIDYTALNLALPQKVRFRYLLEGRDRDWQEAGTRRQAFYNDLRPGRYRFRVTASNNGGAWNEPGASLSFFVAPAYYQTPWFMAVLGGTVILIAWGAHRLRVRIVERHQGEISALNERLMKAQEQERIRIAGELHDGVMQEMQAVTMMLGAAKRRIPADSKATETIDKAQQKLIQAGTDLRQLSHDLHPPLLQEAGLPRAVTAYCEQFGAASGIPVACDADNEVSDLSRGAGLALFRIVQEALGNAAKHAKATQISVRLSRADGTVSLTVADNGVGIDQSRLARGGGLGLIMMRERASQLNGRFEVDSTPGRGTTIRVLIPFR